MYENEIHSGKLSLRDLGLTSPEIDNYLRVCLVQDVIDLSQGVF